MENRDPFVAASTRLLFRARIEARRAMELSPRVQSALPGFIFEDAGALFDHQHDRKGDASARNAVLAGLISAHVAAPDDVETFELLAGAMWPVICILARNRRDEGDKGLNDDATYGLDGSSDESS